MDLEGQYRKVKAKFIVLDPQKRWVWNVRKGGGLAIFEREDLLDGRIRFGIGLKEDNADMIVQPNDTIWARRTVHGYWNERDEWVTYPAPEIG